MSEAPQHDSSRRLVRALHGAVEVPGAAAPWDRVHYHLFHPALFTGADEQRQTGRLPADTDLAPWPVVVLLNGINVGADGYRWLAEHLASNGFATVTFSHVGEISPGDVGLSPGLDLGALRIDEFGTRPSATVVGPLLEALGDEQRDGRLAGLLDLDRVVLGGHSAGGTVALLNADPEWFPGVRGVFSYAGHTMPAALLGHPDGTVLPVPGGTPALVIGGTDDGVVAASAVRYRAEGADDHDPVAATFTQGATAAGSALAVIRGAGHLTFCDPLDPTTARGFLEQASTASDEHAEQERRALIARLVTAFCARVTGSVPTDPSDADPLSDLARSPLIEVFRVR